MELSSDTHDTFEKERRSWFVMRDLSRPNAKLPAYMKLDELGIRCYTPTVWRTMVRNGVRTSRKVPVIHDLLFVCETREVLDPVVAKMPTLQYRFLRRTWREPMTVRDEEMERFIGAAESSGAARYYTPEEITPEMRNRRIRIVGGQMNGYEGTLLTVRGSKKKRLLVEVPSLIAVSVEIEADFIELV